MWAIPIKNKNTHTIIECMEEIFEITTPEIINCDNGSEFTSREFKKLVSEYTIDVKYVNVVSLVRENTHGGRGHTCARKQDVFRK